jgi:hypothetical protein
MQSAAHNSHGSSRRTGAVRARDSAIPASSGASAPATHRERRPCAPSRRSICVATARTRECAYRSIGRGRRLHSHAEWRALRWCMEVRRTAYSFELDGPRLVRKVRWESEPDRRFPAHSRTHQRGAAPSICASTFGRSRYCGGTTRQHLAVNIGMFINLVVVGSPGGNSEPSRGRRARDPLGALHQLRSRVIA